MDILLGKVTQQAMNYAIRSGITITTTYALRQCGRLLKEAPRSKEREELKRLQLRLESKIRIISPAIDMIDLISARGNTSLESAVSLTKEIRYEIQRLGTRLNEAADDEAMLNRKSSRAKSRDETERELRAIIAAIKDVLVRIEDAVPLINLAITTSGVNLSTNLSGTISPSRLLQASTFLTTADTSYTTDPGSRQQVGPTYTCSLYMLFAGHVRPTDEEGIRETTWKEVIHKARVKLIRVPLGSLYDLPGENPPTTVGSPNSVPADAKPAEFAYQLLIIEDLDDDRVHTFDEDEPQPRPVDDVPHAGIRDIVPIHEVCKIFYADTGKILNIGGDSEVNNPVLLLKRDVHAEPPRRMLHRSQMDGYFETPSVNGAHAAEDDRSEIDAQFDRESAPSTPLKASHQQQNTTSAWRLPADLDPEWIALEVYVEDPDSDTDSDSPTPSSRPSIARQTSLDPSLTGALSNLHLHPSTPSPQIPNANGALMSTPYRPLPQIKTTLSLLEMLLKLTALQQFRQASHLAIEDEILNFFLEDSATAGAGRDKDLRQRMRHDALRRVGFDPYDESPIKRRGEEYIQHGGAGMSPRPEWDAEGYQPQLAYDEAYGYGEELHDSYPGSEYAHPHPSIEELPSSPSPRPLLLRQRTPSRGSTPGSVSSEQHRQAVQAKYGGGTPKVNSSRPPGSSAVQTPPSAARTRQAVLRAQSEPKPRSPLGREYVAGSGASLSRDVSESREAVEET